MFIRLQRSLKIALRSYSCIFHIKSSILNKTDQELSKSEKRITFDVTVRKTTRNQSNKNISIDHNEESPKTYRSLKPQPLIKIMENSFQKNALAIEQLRIEQNNGITQNIVQNNTESPKKPISKIINKRPAKSQQKQRIFEPLIYHILQKKFIFSITS